MKKNIILVIEDNDLFRNALVKKLEQEYVVYEASNAYEALKSFKLHPELVILDLKLPEQIGAFSEVKVGFNLLRKIKEFDSMIQVIVLTGELREIDDAVKAMREGAYDYILKEWISRDTERLPTAIKNALERRKLLIEMKEMQKREKEAELGRLAGGIVHELSPIIFLLKECLKDGDKREGLRTVNRLKMLTESLRTYYRNGGKEFVFSPYKISKVIKESIELYELMTKKEKIEIISKVTEDTEVNIDLEMIKIVFSNLISNAIESIKKAKRDHGKITITTSIDKSSNIIQVLVEDNGCGIKPEYKDEIFKPFVTSRKNGIGLGLTISQLIVKKHNGEILVDSKYGKGAKFTVKLPIKI